MYYAAEREHYPLLISLVEELDRAGQLRVFEKHFGGQRHSGSQSAGSIGRLKRAKRRQLYDVELLFDNALFVVELKVNSDEESRWQPPTQTQRIVAKVTQRPGLPPAVHFLYITLGTAEFYTGLNSFKSGPNDPTFRHIRLHEMASFVEDALKLGVGTQEHRDWLNEMQKEITIRQNAKDLLAKFWHFKEAYTLAAGRMDFPHWGYRVCLPELAFPVLGELARIWNTDPKYHDNLMRVQVYPVPRREPKVQDSILNFWELWEKGPTLSCGGVAPGREVYLEINEDFNLHLKVDGDDALAREVARSVEARIGTAPGARSGGRCFYKQQTYVVYEWDPGILENVLKMRRAADNLHALVDHIVARLN